MNMITSHNIATLSDKNGKNDIDVEINRSGEGQSFVEMSMRDKRGDKISAFIPIVELYALTLTLVGVQEQEELMPIRKTTMTTFRRRYIIEAKRNIKKGEKITFTGEINIPTVVEEGLQGILGKKKIKSNLLVPLK